jgi:hypothetical protein
MGHPVLGARLLETCELIVERFQGGSDPVALINGRIDVRESCRA